MNCGKNHRPTRAIDGSVDEDGEPACATHQVRGETLESLASGQTALGSRVPRGFEVATVYRPFTPETKTENAESKSFRENHMSRTCKGDGCKAILKVSNISGFCRHSPATHEGSPWREYARPTQRSSTPHDSDGIVAKRVTAFLTSLPITDQRRLVGAWLAGRI